MTKFALGKRPTALVNAILAVVAICVVIVALTDAGQTLLVAKRSSPDPQSDLTKPLRLEAIQSNGLEELAFGLRAFHYQTKPQGVEVYSDVFYDTDDWRLYRSGYSYRYREAKNQSGEASYGVRLEQESRFVPIGSEKTDLRESLPASVGTAIAQGSWEIAVSDENGVETTRRFLAVLQELGIAPQEIRPRLAAELRRERFDITDKGQNWFELDHEIWTFSPFEDTDRRVRIQDFVIDTRLKRSDPEIFRRVVTMKKLSQMIDGVRAVNRAPHERAIERFGFGTEN